MVKIATFNANAVNRRLPNLLPWLAEARPECSVRPRDAGMRFARLPLIAGIAERTAAVGVDRGIRGRENASDHAPAWVLLVN